AAEAAAGTGALATAQRNLREAMDNLSPAQKRFAEWLFSLRPLLDELRWAAAEAFLPGLQDAMAQLIDVYFPQVKQFVTDISELMGSEAVAWSDWLVQPEVQEFFQQLGDTLLVLFGQGGEIFRNLATGMIPILEGLLPFSEAFGQAMIDLSAAFAEWANSKEGQEAIAAFFNYLQDVSPELWELFAAAMGALTTILIGLVPYTEDLINFFTTIFEWIADQDPEEVGRYTVALIGLVIAFQMFAAAMSLILTTVQLWANLKYVGGLVGNLRKMFGGLANFLGIGKGGTKGGAKGGGLLRGGGIRGAIAGISRAGWLGIAVAALLTLLVVLYDQWKPFRDFVNGIRDVLVTAWNEYIYPALSAMWRFIADILGPVFRWLYENVMKPVWDLIVLAARIGWAAVEVIFKLFQVGIRILGGIFRWLYDKIIKPVWGWISERIGNVWRNNIRPVLNAFGGFIEEHVAPVFRRGVERLEDIWNGLRQAFARPIVWVVDTIINDGILGTLNRVFDHFDICPVSEVTVPRGIRNAAEGNFALGGILPGYTPGQDVHTFVSPTGGTLHLSGGEAILRPEVTRALGRETINE